MEEVVRPRSPRARSNTPDEEVVRPRSPRARSNTPDKARSVRKDPRRSHVDGMREGRLFGDGYRPDAFHYVYVHMAAKLKGREYYEMLGYRVVTKDDGIKVTGRGAERGTDVEFFGHVLMCCPKARHDEIVEFGPGGDTGLANTEVIEKQIVRKQSLGRDSLRGMGLRRGEIRVVDRDRNDPEPEDEEA